MSTLIQVATSTVPFLDHSRPPKVQQEDYRRGTHPFLQSTRFPPHSLSTHKTFMSNHPPESCACHTPQRNPFLDGFFYPNAKPSCLSMG
ncbi:hypothetical protein K443DRAFT_686159 [Laccaria amethystina LaAM-08-1]|uniref:Uncharacterized protein n=1 Tax=Laccaria amethystina LaAM-08-1 TaxID=1095629 RepID=A0A0C9WMQ4_9AGAR|nr:hypothetical protein K443DRAFT_686159 [Laccaria amethystina LaAM-08-1]